MPEEELGKKGHDSIVIRWQEDEKYPSRHVTFSPRNCIECRAWKSLQFFHLIESFLMSFTKIPMFVPIIVHEEVVDLVEVVRLLDEHDKLLFLLRLDRFIQLLNTSSIVIVLEFVFSNLCLTVSENLLSLSFQKNPDLLIF